MARDLRWVCDELARLHADLIAIREQRRATEQAAAMAQDAGKTTPTQQDPKPKTAQNEQC